MATAFCNWNLSWDMNRDGATTISDITAAIMEVLRGPGVILTEMLHDTGFGKFFEFSYLTCRGGTMLTVSVLVWFALITAYFAYVYNT